MRIIYYSYWGTYAAYTMAALHAGIYKPGGLPPEEWIAAQFELCRRYGGQYGNLMFVGLDIRFREVYSMGCKKHAGMVIRALQHISRIFQIEEPVQFIDAGRREGILPVLLQRIGFRREKTAKKLFTIWFQKNYRACLQQVQRTKQTLKDGIIE